MKNYVKFWMMSSYPLYFLSPPLLSSSVIRTRFFGAGVMVSVLGDVVDFDE